MFGFVIWVCKCLVNIAQVGSENRLQSALVFLPPRQKLCYFFFRSPRLIQFGIFQISSFQSVFIKCNMHFPSYYKFLWFLKFQKFKNTTLNENLSLNDIMKTSWLQKPRVVLCAQVVLNWDD